MIVALLLGACVVTGQAVSPAGDGLRYVRIVEPRTGRVLAVTGPDGRFSVEAPAGESRDEATAPEAALEFRGPGRVPLVLRASCGDEIEVQLWPNVHALETVEVSATRLERTYETSPVRVERFDARSIGEAAGSTPSLAAAVQQLPGVGAVGRDGYTSAPTIRGMGRDRSLILLEGVRLSSDRGVGPSGSFLDPFLLRSVDVVRGAAGVAYGSGAIGGVLSAGLGETAATFGGIAKIAGSTNGDGRLVAGRVTGSPGGSWRTAVGGFFRSQDDYSFPDGGTLPEGDASNSGFSHGGGALVAERDTRVGTLRAAGLITAAGDVGRATTQPGRRDTIETEEHVLVAVRFARDDYDRRTELAAGIHRPRTVNRTERFAAAGSRLRTGDIENLSTDVSLSGLWERPAGKGSWLAGVDLFSRLGVDATETTVRFESGSPLPAETTELVKSALRNDLGVLAGWKRPIGHFGETILAARIDWAHREADDRSSSDWISPSVTAGIVQPLSEKWALTGSLGRSFRAPRLQELYFEGDRPGGARVANPDLEPEAAWSVEVGLRGGRDPWSAEVEVWGLLASDLIVQLPLDAAGDTLRHENESQGRLVGAEVALQWAPPSGRSRASVAYARMRGVNEDGDPLPDIPSGELRVTGELRVLGRRETPRLVARAAMRAGGAKTSPGLTDDARWWSDVLGATDIGGDEVAHPGFARWDAGLRIRLGELASLDVSVTNLFDSHFLDRPESDSYPAPGRSVLFELTVGD